ncbi:MAG: hypothetical protein ACI90V_006434 [Bacillariaceae sp.]|jgi:hypothetical protein
MFALFVALAWVVNTEHLKKIFTIYQQAVWIVTILLGANYFGFG